MTEETDNKPVDDPVAIAILLALDAVEGSDTLSFQDIAKQIAEAKRKPKDKPDLWRRYLVAVRQQAIHLAKAGRIEIMRKGAVADPNDFKGIVRLRLAK